MKIEVLRYDNMIAPFAVGKKKLSFGIIDDKENLIDFLMRLAPEQLDKDVQLVPDQEAVDYMDLEHRERLNKHFPEELQSIIKEEVKTLITPYADALARLREPT